VWRDWKNELIYDLNGVTSDKTVLRAAMEALQEKTVYNIRDNAFNATCKRISETLPQPNLYPLFLYAMKQVVGVEPRQMYEEHVCVNECIKFPKLEYKHWLDHWDDR
jgi:hypothetical protein